MLNEPLRSPYDWEFHCLGFPIRVTWTFWALSALIGYSWAYDLDLFYFENDWATPGKGVLLIIWIAVSFVSILIHELGHSIAMRYYGISSYIVLYHFGGLAIPEGAGGFRRTRLTHWSQIVISAAGPLAQLPVGCAVAAFAFMIGHPMGVVGWILRLMGVSLPISEPFSNAIWTGLIDAAIYVNVLWALLNLLPILPLDGGRIAQHCFGWYRRTSGFDEATNLSLIVCIAIVLYAFQMQHGALAIYFIVFGIMNYQNMQSGPQRPW